MKIKYLKKRLIYLIIE